MRLPSSSSGTHVRCNYFFGRHRLHHLRPRARADALESVGCYERAALDANVAVVGADKGDPTDLCGEVWLEFVGDFTAARPCADVSFDTGGKTVILVPGSR